MPTASLGAAKALGIPIFLSTSGICIKGFLAKLRKMWVVRNCQQIVQQFLNAIGEGTLERQDAHALEGGDFGRLLRIGRQ